LRKESSSRGPPGLEYSGTRNGIFILRDEKVDLPEERLVKNELLDDLSTMIETLSENEQMVISLFYKEELTLTEIGHVMKLSTSRISQIHSKALFKLRQSLVKINF
jgi:RNA polymerase sigma factor for flagellar operon FliA